MGLTDIQLYEFAGRLLSDNLDQGVEMQMSTCPLPHDPGNDKCQAQVPCWEIYVGRYKNTKLSVIARSGATRDKALASLQTVQPDAYAVEGTTTCDKLAVQYISRWEHYLCEEHRTDERYIPTKRKDLTNGRIPRQERPKGRQA